MRARSSWTWCPALAGFVAFAGVVALAGFVVLVAARAALAVWRRGWQRSACRAAVAGRGARGRHTRRSRRGFHQGPPGVQVQPRRQTADEARRAGRRRRSQVLLPTKRRDRRADGRT